MLARHTTTTLLLAAGLTALTGCPKPQKEEPPPPPPVSSPDVVPPAAPFNATPVADFADAGKLDGQTPYGQASAYYAQGQLWMGRLVLERKALGADATKDETELLVKICQDQQDERCVDACAKKLGRKMNVHDGGVPGLAKAQLEPTRKTLEPKVLDGRASRDEIRLLKTICEKQSDRMCVALCDTKLK